MEIRSYFCWYKRQNQFIKRLDIIIINVIMFHLLMCGRQQITLNKKFVFLIWLELHCAILFWDKVYILRSLKYIILILIYPYSQHWLTLHLLYIVHYNNIYMHLTTRNNAQDPLYNSLLIICRIFFTCLAISLFHIF